MVGITIDLKHLGGSRDSGVYLWKADVSPAYCWSLGVVLSNHDLLEKCMEGDVYLYLQCFLLDDPWEEAMKKGPLVI